MSMGLGPMLQWQNILRRLSVGSMCLSRHERDKLVMTMRRGRTVMTTLKRVVDEDEDVGGEEVVVDVEDVEEAVDEVVPLEGEAVEEEAFRNLFRRPWES